LPTSTWPYPLLPAQRKFTCVYSEREGQSPIEGRPVKKRATGNNEQNGGQALPGPIDRPSVNPSPKESTVSPMPPTSQPPLAQGSKPILTSAGPSTSQGSDPSPPGSRFVPTNARPTLETYTGGLQFSAEQPQIGPERPVLMSRDTTQSGAPDEEAIIYTQSRMLEDPTGRLRRFSFPLHKSIPAIVSLGHISLPSRLSLLIIFFLTYLGRYWDSQTSQPPASTPPSVKKTFVLILYLLPFVASQGCQLNFNSVCWRLCDIILSSAP